MNRKLNFYHFFEDRMNLYGDRGNMMIMANRAKWRGIDVEVHRINSARDVDLSGADFFLIGGGSDREQCLIVEDLLNVKSEFKAAIEDGVSALTICGGYQILGNYYELADGTKIPGLDVLDFFSISNPKQRYIGNVVLRSEQYGKLVGFENHGGETYHHYDVLGEVEAGYGNNGQDKKEGILYKNLIGTYLHGPVLGINPVLADSLLSRALERKYGDGTLTPLDDNFEFEGNKKQMEVVLS